jgi:general secretion pathway protein G
MFIVPAMKKPLMGLFIMIGKWHRNFRQEKGFTFIELLVVLAILSLLAGLVVSVAVGKIQQSKESALKEDLHQMRKCIDDFYADNGKYPQKLDDLVDKHYMRSVPVDPMTESKETWQVVDSTDPLQKNVIVDVHSGSEDKSSDGSNYNEW